MAASQSARDRARVRVLTVVPVAGSYVVWEISEGAGSSRRSQRREGRSRSCSAVDRGGVGCFCGIAGSGARERGCG